MLQPTRLSRYQWPIRILLAACIAAPAWSPAHPQSLPAAHSFGVQQDHFALDGKPFRIISGEMHYARVPRAYWRARLKMARAMGLNTVATYVFWNAHEPTPGHYDFSGNNDVAAFIKAATWVASALSSSFGAGATTLGTPKSITPANLAGRCVSPQMT